MRKEKAEHEKQRKEQAIANATGLRVLAAVSAAVPVRLMKRDLLFVIEKLVSLMEEPRLEMLARQHGIRQKRDDGGIGKTLAAYIRRADEGTLSRLLVETSILLAASRSNPATILRDAASMYKVDTDAITLKVKQEFAAKEKAKKTPPTDQPRLQESGLANHAQRGGISPPLHFAAQKSRRENPCWFLPAPSSRCRPPLAGCAAGATFPLPAPVPFASGVLLF